MTARSLSGIGTVLLAAGLGLGLAHKEAGAELILTWYTIDAGGHTFSTGGPYVLGGTCGQPDAGVLRAGDLELLGGFWMGGELLATAIEESEESTASNFELHVEAGIPNPFATKTDIALDLPDSRPVQILIFNYSGRLIRSLCDQVLPAGHHRFEWNGRDNLGHRVASGVYLMKIVAGQGESKRRVTLVR